jgi:hypothetical protein
MLPLAHYRRNSGVINPSAAIVWLTGGGRVGGDGART